MTGREILGRAEANSKSSDVYASVGSNPTLSAIVITGLAGVILRVFFFLYIGRK